MSRYFAFWIVLTTVGGVAGSLIAVVGFRHVDLAFENFVQLLTVPACQALLLTLATRTGRGPSPASLGVRAAAHPLVRPMLVMDAIVMLISWGGFSHHVLGISGEASLVPVWVGTKAIASAVFVLAAAITATGIETASPWRPGERVGLTLFAIALLAVGVEVFHPWMGGVPAMVMPTRPRIVQWIVVYGAAYATALGLTLAVSRMVRRRSLPAAAAIEAATGSAFVCALVVVSTYFLHPFLDRMPLALARTAMSLTMTFLLVSGILLASPASTDA